MTVVRFSRLVAAGAMAWAACCPAQTAADPVGAPSLRLSTTLSRLPEAADTEPTRGPEGQRFSERALQPVGVLRQSREQRERDLLEALATARGQQQATGDIERRLAQVRSQRYANPVVYTLAGLLAAAASGAAFFWWRMRTPPQRRRPGGESTVPDGSEPA